MQAEYVRTRLVQMEVLPGRPADNTTTVLQHVAAAQRDGIDLLVFPEMAIPGYLLGDEWEHHAFLRECEACADEIRRAAHGPVVVFGSVGIDWSRKNEDGRVRKYNAVFVAEDGEFRGPAAGPYPFAIKTLLPNYRVFDDSRHFHDLRKLALELDKPVRELIAPIPTRRLRLGCMLCEDTWDMDYGVSPLAELARAGADLLINISCSPYTLNKNSKRHRVFAHRMPRLNRPLLYVNNVGIQNNGKTVLTFDGSSCAYDSRGGVVSCGTMFEDTTLTLDIPLQPGAAFGEPTPPPQDDIAQISRALLYGTGKMMQHLKVSRVVVGISGGIDSAVVAALYRRLLEPSNLLLVNMPGTYTSATTRRLATDLAANLGCLFCEVPIMDSVRVTTGQIDNLRVRSADGSVQETLTLRTLDTENIQARDRSSRVLAAIASAFGGVFTCNANKSEATVGYTTLYGDLGGYLANIADLWKTEVYALARHLNRDPSGRDIIPGGTLDLVPSAELSPAQNVDKGQGDPLLYPYHDRLFRSWVERWDRTTPEDILEWYAAGHLESELEYEGSVGNLFPTAEAFVADLERWWNLYQGIGVAKRIQAPPVLAIKRRTFGFDHRESQLGPRYTRRYRELKTKLLQPAAGS